MFLLREDERPCLLFYVRDVEGCASTTICVDIDTWLGLTEVGGEGSSIDDFGRLVVVSGSKESSSKVDGGS